jgi:hypothetical protein
VAEVPLKQRGLHDRDVLISSSDIAGGRHVWKRAAGCWRVGCRPQFTTRMDIDDKPSTLDQERRLQALEYYVDLLEQRLSFQAQVLVELQEKRTHG